MTTGLEKNPTWLPVVAGRLVDRSGRWLMHQRPDGKEHAGLWEFPGGKVEHGETPRVALVRELEEELGIHVHAATCRPSLFTEAQSGGDCPNVVLFLYTVIDWSGRPTAVEGGDIGWYRPDEVRVLETPPLDRLLIDDLTGGQ